MRKQGPPNIPTTIKNESLVRKRREQIFEAAVKLFSEKNKGYHVTTLREISKASGITLGNLYDYISKKADILSIVQEKSTQAIYEAISKVVREADNPLDKLKKLICSEIDVIDKFQDIVLIIYQETHSLDTEMLYNSLSTEREHIGYYEKVIEEGIEQKLFKPMNVRMGGNFIKVLIDAWALKRWDLKDKVTLEEWKQGVLDVILNGICICPPSNTDSLLNKEEKISKKVSPANFK